MTIRGRVKTLQIRLTVKEYAEVERAAMRVIYQRQPTPVKCCSTLYETTTGDIDG